MSTTLQETERAATPLPANWSIADLQHYLGDVPLERIRLFPSPGTATEAHLVAALNREHRLCELVDGVLVEKDMATFESSVAAYLIHLIHVFLATHPIGMVTAPDGPLRLSANRVRMPDVSVIRWERFPNRKLPASQAVFAVVPNLAVEILSAGNTRREMELKRDEYLDAGVQLVWYIDPRARTATVYSTDGPVQEFDESGILSGADVLPGFELPLKEFFDHFPIEQE